MKFWWNRKKARKPAGEHKVKYRVVSKRTRIAAQSSMELLCGSFRNTCDEPVFVTLELEFTPKIRKPKEAKHE